MALDFPTPTGPFLDRLFAFFLPGGSMGGRMVDVTAFSVLPSNVGILEGGLDKRANADQREKVLAFAKTHYGGPLVVVEPTIVPLPELGPRQRERLPWMACMAQLGSSSTHLTLVWWQDSFEAPLPLEIARAAAGIDWAASCEEDLEI